MVDGEASVMMMAMISSKSPSRQSARTEFLVPELGFRVVTAQRNFSLENFEPPVSLRLRGICMREGRPRRWLGRPHHPQARPGPGPRLGLVWATQWSSPSQLLAPWVFWQNRIFGIFSGIFPES